MQDQPNTEQAETPSIDDQVVELFDAMNRLPEDATDEVVQAALLAQSDKIHAISQACEKSPLYIRAKAKVDEMSAEFAAQFGPERQLMVAWLWFLDRMACAPNYVLQIGTIRLCLPMVARHLPPPAAQATSAQGAGL